MTDKKYDLEIEAVFEEVKEKPKTKKASKKKTAKDKTEQIKAQSAQNMVYNIVVPFQDYKDMLDEYKIIDNKVIYRTYSNKSLAERIADNLIRAGIYAVVEAK